MSSKSIVNLTGIIVLEEIERIIEVYPDDHPYKLTFSTPELKKQLTELVLSRVRNRYAQTQDEQGRIVYPDFSRCSLEQKLHMEQLIPTAMAEIFQQIDCSNYPHQITDC